LKEKTSILEKISLFSGAWTVEIWQLWLVAWDSIRYAYDKYWNKNETYNNYYYSQIFYFRSLIWSWDQHFSDDSNYVKKLKKTDTFSRIINDAKSEYNREHKSQIYWKINESEDPFSLYTLWKFYYTSNVKETNTWLQINVQIKDTYDFNLKLDDESYVDKWVNFLHIAQENWFIKPYDNYINLNYEVWKE
jgi:hypothetical protein